MRQRIIAPATLLAQLSVVELSASGYHNNCLWFSVQRATGQVSADGQYTEAAETASDKGRTQIHQELLRALPAAADAHIGLQGKDVLAWRLGQLIAGEPIESDVGHLRILIVQVGLACSTSK